jgi:glycosyltransferase involved in cell wall biosynthesis
MIYAQTFASINPTRQADTIAVIVPNYNHGQFLAESLSSIVNQTRAPDEVLIIDDGSRDNSVEIISRFLKNRPTWQIIGHKDNCGVVKRLNEGIATVRSKWITMLGADDLLDPEYLDCIMQMAAQYSSAGLVCACVEIFGNAIRPRLRPPILPRTTPGYVTPDRFRDLLRIGDNYFIGTATAYQRQIILDVGGLDEQLGSICDGYLARQIAARHGFGFVPQVLGYWRIHGKNYSVSTAKDPIAIENGIQTVRAAVEREQAGTFPSHYADMLDRRLRFGGSRLVVLDRNIPPAEQATILGRLLKSRRFERYAFRVLAAAGRIGSILILTWLTIRLQPLSLLELIRQLPLRRSIQDVGKRKVQKASAI